MNTFVFQPGMTWRKLGFALYSNSTSYREVLEQNPIWDVTVLPPAGATLKGSSFGNSTGGASQQPSIYSLQSASSSEDYAPFDSQSSYWEALSRYSPSCLRRIVSINGLTNDNFLVP